ncbi:YndM family protein [Lederbergia sp. NSJ-179]|uniref:YndM family protein n=1 Tax=Lederbergia sp. NSJ-179 TaxID=2931402 RepID=UPI001FD15FA3|nr:YndM family protein [Lederbergia sp. NSJ-179]MCJ7843143.1 YndM family protein [Lederbergia sp. NSJ-179]
MDHLKAIAIKFIASLALLYVVLGLMYGMAFGNVLLITVTLGVISYLIGDLLILPRTNNSVATAADFGLSLIVIWMMSDALTIGRVFTMSLIAAVGITIVEYFFHKYMANEVLEETKANPSPTPRNAQYQTEASEELSGLDETMKQNEQQNQE